jgi:hypothetical protein
VTEKTNRITNKRKTSMLKGMCQRQFTTEIHSPLRGRPLGRGITCALQAHSQDINKEANAPEREMGPVSFCAQDGNAASQIAGVCNSDFREQHGDLRASSHEKGCDDDNRFTLTSHGTDEHAKTTTSTTVELRARFS